MKQVHKYFSITIIFIAFLFFTNNMYGNGKEPTFIACDDICSVWECETGCSGCSCSSEPSCESYCGTSGGGGDPIQ